MKAALLVLIAEAITSPGYQVCRVIEDPIGEYPEVTCYDTRDIGGWRMCSDKEATPPGGIFVDFNQPFRWEGYAGTDNIPNYTVSGRAHFKEVARNENGVAFATAFITRPSLGFMDGMEPMDQFATSSCTYSRIINQ